MRPVTDFLRSDTLCASALTGPVPRRLLLWTGLGLLSAGGISARTQPMTDSRTTERLVAMARTRRDFLE